MLDADPEVGCHRVITGIPLDEVENRDDVVHDLPDREVAPAPRDIGAVHDVDTGTVGSVASTIGFR